MTNQEHTDDEVHAALLARLKLAEDVCVMLGWSSFDTHSTPRSRATYMLWQRWADVVGDEFTEGKAHPDLVLVEKDLAARR